MRIILASFSSLPRTVGGGEVHAFGLALALKKLGHQPSLLSVEKVGAEQVSVRRDYLADIPVDFLTVPECKTIYERHSQLTSWACEWLAAEKVDVAHLFIFNHLLGLIPAAQQLNIPVCYTALEFSYFCRRYDMLFEGREHCQPGAKGETCENCALSSYSGKQRALSAVARLFPSSVENRLREISVNVMGEDRLVSLGQRNITNQIAAQQQAFEREIAAVITPSSIMREFFTANGVAPAKIHFIPYGTSFDFQSSKKKEGRVEKDLLSIGYIGRLDPKKGVHVLCEAISKLPPDLPLQVKIFGPFESAPEDYLATLRQYAEKDRRIQFLGRLDRSEVAKAYEQVDVLVVPSLWYENSPITITEAFAYNCPVICSDTAGMTDLVTNEVNGLTFPLGDGAKLAACLQRLFATPELLSQLRSGITPPENSTEIATKIELLYKGLLDSRDH